MTDPSEYMSRPCADVWQIWFVDGVYKVKAKIPGTDRWGWLPMKYESAEQANEAMWKLVGPAEYS